MELNRVDYALLKVLLKNDSVSFFKGMTIYEILDVLGGSRVTTYKKAESSCEVGICRKRLQRYQCRYISPYSKRNRLNKRIRTWRKRKC